MSVVIWCLPRDILHSIYSEWLGWKDLSMLDIACVEKNEREEWLTSLTDLRISNTFWHYISNEKWRIFYKWLSSRNVFCVEDFPVRLVFLEDLVTVLDMKAYCPTIRSIEVRKESIFERSSDSSHVKKYLPVFLSHCHNLQGVTVWMDSSNSNLVLSVLKEQLRENSLVKISLHDIEEHHESNVTDSIIKHASSLRVLCISTIHIDIVDTGFVISTLIKNQICLRELSIITFEMPSLISYISSSGGLLEVLEVSNIYRTFNAEDLVASVATSCPKMTRLETSRCKPCSIETLQRLYEQCPHLQYVFFGSLKIDDKRKSVSMEVRSHNEDWVICLSHVLRRTQYKKVTLRLIEDYNYRVGNLKSMLEPYEIDLDASTTSESSLISILQDLPHVNIIQLHPTVNNQYTDATLAAISKHANSLTELKFANINFSDKLLSELIKTCGLLERFIMNDCGLESFEAISKLSNLNMVKLSVNRSISREVLNGLLLDEKVTWPSTLMEGYIKAEGYRIPYKFNNKSHQWIRRS